MDTSHFQTFLAINKAVWTFKDSLCGPVLRLLGKFLGEEPLGHMVAGQYLTWQETVQCEGQYVRVPAAPCPKHLVLTLFQVLAKLMAA